jgi:hypothetical protein
MGNPRFSLRSAVIGYAIAIVFAFNGVLTSVIDAGSVAGGNPFAILCLNSNGQPQLPGQADHGMKCSCSLSCCCASGEINRASHEIDLVGPVAVAELSPDRPERGLRDFLADHRNRPRPPPALL